MLFSRPADDAPLAAERVQSVLSRPAAVPLTAGGWVPDADAPGAPPAGEEPRGPTARPAEPLGGPSPPDARSGPPERLGSALSPPSGWPAQDPAPSAPGPAPDPTVRWPLVPAVLASGRFDPGRRGAVALVLAALLAALVTAVGVGRSRPVEVPAPDVVATGVPLPGASAPAVAASAGGAAPAGAPAAPTEVVVAVAGTVVRPGIVRLPAGSRVDDAVRAAGGPRPGTGTGLLNLARVLVDGEQVLVGVDPPPGAPAPVAGAVAGGAPATGGPLDLNAATVGDLDALPGIGPVLAQRIVDWRTEHGRFASVEQLREVTGIGESKYADLEPKVTVP